MGAQTGEHSVAYGQPAPALHNLELKVFSKTLAQNTESQLASANEWPPSCWLLSPCARPRTQSNSRAQRSLRAFATNAPMDSLCPAIRSQVTASVPLLSGTGRCVRASRAHIIRTRPERHWLGRPMAAGPALRGRIVCVCSVPLQRRAPLEHRVARTDQLVATFVYIAPSLRLSRPLINLFKLPARTRST